jgi:hypothetical protein
MVGCTTTSPLVYWLAVSFRRSICGAVPVKVARGCGAVASHASAPYRVVVFAPCPAMYSKAVHIATFETWIRALRRFKTGKASTYHPPTAGRVAVTRQSYMYYGICGAASFCIAH